MESEFRTYRVWLHYRWRILVASLVLVFATSPTIQATFMESRAYRDFMLLTPFYNAKVIHASVSSDLASLQLDGTLVKRRCNFVSLSAYVTKGEFSYASELVLEYTDDNRRVTNRPPMDKAQHWGPWVIMSPVQNPEAYSIFVMHICPNTRIPQTNLFVAGPWKDYP